MSHEAYSYNVDDIEPINKQHFSTKDQTSIFNEAAAAAENLKKSTLNKNKDCIFLLLLF